LIHPDLPLKAISIMQPWAWLIVNGHKDIENRDWATKFRGFVAIHAGKKLDETAAISVDRAYHPVSGRRIRFAAEGHAYQRGGIVGVAEIVDCIPHANSDLQDECSEWFVGRYGFLLRNARPVSFIPCKGALSFFDWRKNL